MSELRHGHAIITGLVPGYSTPLRDMADSPHRQLHDGHWSQDRHLPVHTVGLLLVAVGVVLCLAAYQLRNTLEMIVLAAGAALALIGIDLIYTWIGMISTVYLLDAAVEIPLVANSLWLGFTSAKETK